MSAPQTPSKTPRITLVGAGPGDPDLITVRALKTLNVADVVLYDALVSEEILRLIPDQTPAWSVGKRAGAHSFKQDEINTLMVEFAYQYGHVVRLKGGDPFVFGRGQEEIEYAIAEGIAVDLVPGISSAIAVPAAARIPLTRRTTSESFWVVTGMTKSGSVSQDIALAAQSTATVVILMGLGKIQEIMALFQQQGKHHVPVAVIQQGTLPSQRVLIGTVSTIAEDVKKNNVTSPALIVVGEVVRYASPEIVKGILAAQGISVAQ